jgi:LysM repeat protein
MKNRASAPARALAAIAVVGGFVVVFVLIGAALSDGGDDSGDGQHRGARHSKQATKPQKEAPASYEIESGDTLTSIAHETGVPVAQIERLNPGVDPQILVAGEKLKLR